MLMHVNPNQRSPREPTARELWCRILCMTGEAGSEAKRPPRRRRRRRRPRKQPAETAAAGVEPAGAATGSEAARPLEPSKIDASKPADVPLGEAELAEMKNHLKFLFGRRKILRLKVNAAEDLLLNGSREPTHRGHCLHLLAKVNLSCIQSALDRLSDAKDRLDLLAGVVSFSMTLRRAGISPPSSSRRAFM